MKCNAWVATITDRVVKANNRINCVAYHYQTEVEARVNYQSRADFLRRAYNSVEVGELRRCTGTIRAEVYAYRDDWQDPILAVDYRCAVCGASEFQGLPDHGDLDNILTDYVARMEPE